MNVQPARESEMYGIGPGLSERDFMTRQRYLENSGYADLLSLSVYSCICLCDDKFPVDFEVYIPWCAYEVYIP